MVIRDWQGKFVAAGAIQRQYYVDPLLVEALAAREGIPLVLRMGLDRIVVESDCQQSLHMLQQRTILLGFLRQMSFRL
ncbi:hypothetical protein RHGRI_006099 [Rhododendron griersonianum]|uniref:RNase H type-1 domain-containing protein n=1 Tax=Rhododendron griersonianum TaxID=479676 RepID=A0AAV6LEK5_9ERIC|nr:hypothetical protein RHGRI_006099 [Rhododendron griersonianum]